MGVKMGLELLWGIGRVRVGAVPGRGPPFVKGSSSELWQGLMLSVELLVMLLKRELAYE